MKLPERLQFFSVVASTDAHGAVGLLLDDEFPDGTGSPGQSWVAAAAVARPVQVSPRTVGLRVEAGAPSRVHHRRKEPAQQTRASLEQVVALGVARPLRGARRTPALGLALVRLERQLERVRTRALLEDAVAAAVALPPHLLPVAARVGVRVRPRRRHYGGAARRHQRHQRRHHTAKAHLFFPIGHPETLKFNFQHNSIIII